MSQSEKDQPNVLSHTVKAMRPAIQKCRDVAGGSETIKSKNTDYLPRHPKETWDNYSIRLSRPVFFNAFKRTVKGLTGLVFRRDPVLAEDVPSRIEALWENIDNRNTHGSVFLKTVFEDAVEAGHVYVMVDVPQVEGELNLAQQQALNIRPYWVHYRAEDVTNLRYEYINGQLTLTQITFEITSYEGDGEFGDKEVTYYRVYKREGDVVSWEKWSKNDKGDFIKEAGDTIVGVTEIPLAVVYGEQVGPFMSKPPLEDLADQNILHYQTNSDYHHAAHIANVPLPVVTGVGEDGKDITWGPNAALILPEGATAGWMETSGSALGHTRQMLQDIESRMATLGLNMLAREKRAAETATARRIDKAEADSALGGIARSLEDAAEILLGYTAQFMKERSGGSIEINKDYEDQQLTPQEIDVWSRLVANGQISLATMWKMLEQGEWLPPDWTEEEERMNLEADMGAFNDTQDKEGVQGDQPQDGQAIGDVQNQGGSRGST